MLSMNRRGFLAISTGLCALPLVSRHVFAGPAAMTLDIVSRTIEVKGRAAKVWGLTNANGQNGLVLEPGQRFAVDLTNRTDIETLIHWHGQIPPNEQDGVPNMPRAMLKPGEMRSYDYAARPGTHWMHAHIPDQEVGLLAAPLIVRSAQDLTADRQDVTMFLHDFSFRSPAEVLSIITSGASAGGMPGMTMPGSGMDGMDMSGSDMSGMTMSGTGGMAMDLNDFDFDAYLVNDRTLDDPDVVQVDKGGLVRVRIVNAAAATVFWIDTGALDAVIVAVDGEDVKPFKGHRFGIAMGQRMDIELTVPLDGGAFPILALREGTTDRTGLILATAGAEIAKIGGTSDTAALAFGADTVQESSLRATVPVADRPTARQVTLMLAGSMSPYVWTINGQTLATHIPVEAKTGERVEITFHNMSMMSHPMHLHGHKFQVVEFGGQRFAGALRDTVLVPPMAAVTVALDAGEAASWMLHCHHMAHLATGMMTTLAVTA
ncbi:MAG: multicopper oxidase domain-containing protein [Paracoccaceae bacterium]